MKKFISFLLALTLMITSINVVFAGSTNSVTRPFEVLLNNPVKNENGEFAKLKIQPRNEIEAGDSIIISVAGGIFDHNLLSDCEFRTNKTATTYDQIISSGLQPYDALVKYIGSENSRELPYGFRYINESELEIKLYPIEDYKVNQNNNDVTRGVPLYNIALPIVAGDKEDNITIWIDDNGTIVTGGAEYTIAYAVSELTPVPDDPDNYYPVSSQYAAREIVVFNNEPVRYNNEPNELIIQPTRNVNEEDYILLKIKNGSFDESMLEECAYRTNETYTTYDQIISSISSGLQPYDALVRYVGNENSRELPYKLAYISEDTIEAELFPIMDNRVNQDNTDVTYGTPIYRIALPAVAGSELGMVSVAVDGNNSTIKNSGYYDIAEVVNPYDSFELSIIPSDMPVTYAKNIVLPDIFVKEIYPNAFNSGKVSITLCDGCSFVNNSGIVLPGINCYFQTKNLSGSSNELVFDITGNFDKNKISSVILSGIEISADADFSGDVNITVSGDGLSTDITKTIKAAEILKYDGPEIKGDADNNGIIAANDISIVINRILNNSEYIAKLDVNDDGIINSADAAQILQKALDFSYEYTSDN